MNSIRDEVVALDTNEFIFALRRDADHPACEILLFDKLNQLHVYMPLQVLIELQRQLRTSEMRDVLLALTKAKAVKLGLRSCSVRTGIAVGATWSKKGRRSDCCHLEAAAIRYLVSENRDFLVDLPNLPFEALTAEKAVQLLS